MSPETAGDWRHLRCTVSHSSLFHFLCHSRSLLKLFHVSLSYETFEKPRRKMIKRFSAAIHSHFSTFSLFPRRSLYSAFSIFFSFFFSFTRGHDDSFSTVKRSRYDRLSPHWRVVHAGNYGHYRAITVLFETWKSIAFRELITGEVELDSDVVENQWTKGKLACLEEQRRIGIAKNYPRALYDS